MGVWQIIWLALSLVGVILKLISAKGKIDGITSIICFIIETFILYQGGFYKF